MLNDITIHIYYLDTFTLAIYLRLLRVLKRRRQSIYKGSLTLDNDKKEWREPERNALYL